MDYTVDAYTYVSMQWHNIRTTSGVAFTKPLLWTKLIHISFNKESGSMEAKSLTLQLCPLTVIDVIIHCMRSIISMSIIFYNIIPLTSDLIHL